MVDSELKQPSSHREKLCSAVDPTNNSSDENKHILVVDDEITLICYLKELLQLKGYDVTISSDSWKAWDIFCTAPDSFDLVLTDQTMPGLSGVQLASKMLTLNQELPIILCTGYSEVVNEFNIGEYGIQSYMPKPLDTRELLRNVAELLLAS